MGDDPPFKKRTFKKQKDHLSDGNSESIDSRWTSPYGSPSSHGRLGTRDQIKTDLEQEQAELARDARARNVAEDHTLFDKEVLAEAKCLNITLAISTKFAGTVRAGLEKRLKVARVGDFKILKSVRRLKAARRRKK
jgi:hypothetical protein